MRILLTNIWLRGRSGTEIVTIELATGLARLGHDVAVFSPEVGTSGDQLRQSGIRVTNQLHELSFEPDVVHGNHSVDLLHGLIRYPNTPGVFVCHNPDHWICSPPDLTQVRAFLSVDRLGQERIVRDLPRVRDEVRIIPNAVDLERYRPRAPLPARPRKALALTKFSSHLPAVQEACSRCGLELDFAGSGVGHVSDDLPSLLQRYDVVFATARMALEAMAVGCAAIVVDARGLAGMVTSRNVAQWRVDNFGKRALSRPVTTNALVDEIALYDATDAAAVAIDVRTYNALDRCLSAYEAVYRDVAGSPLRIDKHAAAREWSAVMLNFLPPISGIPTVSFEEVGGRASWLERELEARQRDVDWRDEQLAAMKHDVDWLRNELEARQRDVDWRDAQLAAMKRDVEQFRGEILTLRTELQDTLRAKDAEFQAYRDWVAPRNLGRRIAHKLRRTLLRGSESQD